MSDERTDLVSGRVGLRIGETTIEADMTLPAGPTRMRELLPVLQAWTDQLVELAEAQVKAEGKKVSCHAGCGACCRQLVPVSPAEAHALAALVEALPEPRQRAIRARFAAVEARLEETGMRMKIETLRGSREEVTTVALAYFGLQIACPFLEDESCSIHAARPLICREYLVTSDAKHCRQPTQELVQTVKLPGKLSLSVAQVEMPPTKEDPGGMRGKVPLTLALRYAREHAEAAGTQSGPELFGKVLKGVERGRE